jgi:hypothetical protein
MKTLTNEQFSKLAKTCENLFREGTPTLRFIRTLHNDYQIFCNDDLESPDDFYNMFKPENQPMNDLLNLLGYKYSNFGICRLN